MRKEAIKKVLFTLASFAAITAKAEGIQQNDLTLMEELPVEQRAVVHKHVLEFLAQNPGIAKDASVIAIDRKGTVYVLDENKIFLAKAGAPSCITSGGVR